MKRWIEQHFGSVMLLACMAGLIVPGLPLVPDAALPVILGMLMFTSCFRLQDETIRIAPREIACFYGLRWFVLPLIVWGVMHLVSPIYAVALLLLVLLPPGVSSPAIVHLYGGKVALAFAITLPATLLAPFYIPFVFTALAGGTIAIDAFALFKTLVLTVLLPILLWRIARRRHGLSAHMRGHDRVYAILLIASIIAVVVAKQRAAILAEPLALLPPFLLAIAMFTVLLLVGWYFRKAEQRPNRISYMVCSGFNNVALGVSLAFLHLPPQAVLFFVACEVAWSALPAITRTILHQSSATLG